MKRFASITLVLYMTTACSNQTRTGARADTKAESEKLMQASREWAIAAKERNTDKVLEFWQDDAIMLNPAHPVLTGKQAISEKVNASYADSSFSISWEPISASVSEDGTMGYIIQKTVIKFNGSTGPVT